MANTRRLTDSERELAGQILEKTRKQLEELAKNDRDLLWAARRYVYIRLQHDERGKPMERKILKMEKMISQNSKCLICGEKLPKRGAVLDRIAPMEGYTFDNTRLLCQTCDRNEQEKRGFA